MFTLSFLTQISSILREFKEHQHCIKDDRSVSLYPYNQSQILQNVKYTKYINTAKGFAKYFDK